MKPSQRMQHRRHSQRKAGTSVRPRAARPKPAWNSYQHDEEEYRLSKGELVHRALASVSPNNPMAREEAERKVERLLAGSMSRKSTGAASTRTPRRNGRLASAISTAVAEAVHRAEESKTPYIDARLRRTSQPRDSPAGGRLSTGGPSSKQPVIGAAAGETGEHLGHAVARNLAAELSGAAAHADQSEEQLDPRPAASSAPSPSPARPPGPGPKHPAPRGATQSYQRHIRGAITRSPAMTHTSQQRRFSPPASARAPLSPYASKAGSMHGRTLPGMGSSVSASRQAQQCDAPEEQGAKEWQERGVKPLSPAQLRERFRRSPDACLLAVVQAVARKAARDRGEPLPSKESSAFSPLGTPAFIRRREYEEGKLLMEAGDGGVDQDQEQESGPHERGNGPDLGRAAADERGPGTQETAGQADPVGMDTSSGELSAAVKKTKRDARVAASTPKVDTVAPALPDGPGRLATSIEDAAGDKPQATGPTHLDEQSGVGGGDPKAVIGHSAPPAGTKQPPAADSEGISESLRSAGCPTEPAQAIRTAGSRRHHRHIRSTSALPTRPQEPTEDSRKENRPKSSDEALRAGLESSKRRVEEGLPLVPGRRLTASNRPSQRHVGAWRAAMTSPWSPDRAQVRDTYADYATGRVDLSRNTGIAAIAAAEGQAAIRGPDAHQPVGPTAAALLPEWDEGLPFDDADKEREDYVGKKHLRSAVIAHRGMGIERPRSQDQQQDGLHPTNQAQHDTTLAKSVPNAAMARAEVLRRRVAALRAAGDGAGGADGRAGLHGKHELVQRSTGATASNTQAQGAGLRDTAGQSAQEGGADAADRDVPGAVFEDAEGEHGAGAWMSASHATGPAGPEMAQVVRGGRAADVPPSERAREIRVGASREHPTGTAADQLPRRWPPTAGVSSETDD